MYYMIIMLKFMEPEAEVKLVQNFYYKIYLVCIWEAGKEVLQPAPVNSLRLRRLRNGVKTRVKPYNFIHYLEKLRLYLSLVTV